MTLPTVHLGWNYVLEHPRVQIDPLTPKMNNYTYNFYWCCIWCLRNLCTSSTFCCSEHYYKIVKWTPQKGLAVRVSQKLFWGTLRWITFIRITSYLLQLCYFVCADSCIAKWINFMVTSSSRLKKKKVIYTPTQGFWTAIAAGITPLLLWLPGSLFVLSEFVVQA